MDVGSTPLSRAVAALTASGQPYEMRTEVIRGVTQRVFVKSVPTLRHLVETATGYGERPFLVLGDARWSFQRHATAVASLANWLVDNAGIQPGDRVAIAMRNRPEWSVAFWATVSIGAIAVPLNSWWVGPELEFALRDSGARVTLVDHERAERLIGHTPPTAERLITVDEDPLDADRFTGTILERLAELLADDRGMALPAAVVQPDDPATLLYTSGTTGRPKGVLGSHRNMTTNVLNRRFWRDAHDHARTMDNPGPAHPSVAHPSVEQPPVTLLTVPLFHATGLHSYLLLAMAAGSTLVLMHRWNVDEALALAQRENVTAMGGVPFMALQLLDTYDPAVHDLRSLASLTVGGASSPPSLAPRLAQRLGHVTFGNGYGMTETSAVAVFNHGAEFVARPDAIGRAVPTMDAKVVDESGHPVANGQRGELWLRGPNVTIGYWNRPEETASTFLDDGWLRTGDIVVMENDGLLCLVDRAKELIVRGGENIAPVEVEAAMITHPDITDAAAVALEHPTLGEQVGALVVLRSGSSLTAEDVRAHVGASLAAFKVPSVVVFTTESLPRNPQGKLLRSSIAKLIGGSTP